MALIIPIFIVLFFFVSPSGFFETFIALVFGYIVGSVAYLINPNIQGYPKGFIKTFKDSEYLNAIGNFIIA